MGNYHRIATIQIESPKGLGSCQEIANLAIPVPTVFNDVIEKSLLLARSV